MPTRGIIVKRLSTPCGHDNDQTVSALQVAPSVVEFLAFERGTCYLATLNVRNASDRVLRYRLTPPPNVSPFKVLLRGRDLAKTENATVSLPPGLSVRYDVTFQIPDNNAPSAIVHDALQINGDDTSALEVPLVARRACPLLNVTPLQCELGFVVLTQRSAQCIEVQNIGTRRGRFVVDVLDAGSSSAKAAIKVSPERGKLDMQERVKVQIELQGLDIGAFRGIVQIRIWEIMGQEEKDDGRFETLPSAEQIVDVSGKVVEHTVELVLRQGLEAVQSLFFGSLFAGERRSIETILRNNGPLPLTFKTCINFRNGQTIEDDERYKELEITPENGCLDPFSTTVLKFVYHPRAKTMEEIQELEEPLNGISETDLSSRTIDSTSPFSLLSGPAKTLNAFASIQCENVQAQDLTFEISAKTFIPRFSLSPSLPLDFGDVRTHDRVDLLLSVKNLAGLPMHFKACKNVAHFSIRPRVGRLDVLQSQNLVVSFTPTQLGTFSTVIALQVNNGVLDIPIKVRGRAAVLGPVPPINERLVGGPFALPVDFAPKFHFLLPDQAKDTKGKLSRRFYRQPPYERAALNGTAAFDEFEFQGTNNTHLTYCVKELARRAEHRAAYHEYLTQSRVQREAKGKGLGKAFGLKKRVAQARGTNQDDDVDLGLTKLQPPPIHLPRSILEANEPLWVSRHSTDGSLNLLFDDLKLIAKKFKSLPATPAEVADCAQILDLSELELVRSGPKTINFGRLCINGRATRGLTVQNNMARNVLVTLQLEMSPFKEGDSLHESALKTPVTSQVIPPHSKAGFDLIFRSDKEQYYQQNLTLLLNNHHFRHVTVVAEVAPMIVELTPSDLLFDFDALDLSFNVSRDVSITNTSDCDAPFTWTCLPLIATQDGTPPLEPLKSDATTTNLLTDRSYGTNTTLKTPIFELFPPNGVLGPSASQLCKVVYTPPLMTKATMTALELTQKSGAIWLSQLVQLDVTGGEKSLLNCRALVPDVKIVTRDTKIDFGTISVGLEREKTFVLHNTDLSSRAVFSTRIEPLSLTTSIGLQVLPAQSVINPQESTEVMVKFLPHRAITLDTSTKAQSATVVVSIRGGNVLRLPITASVLIPDIIVGPCDVIDFGQVVLGVSVSRVISLENHSPISASLYLDFSSLPFAEEFTLATPRRFLAQIEDTGTTFCPLVEEQSEGRCLKWQLCLPPHVTLDLQLVFTPARIYTHDLELPLEIAGSGPRILSTTSPNRRIVASAILPRLCFSTSTLHFQRCVITRDGLRKVPYTKTIILANEDNETMQWQIDTNCLRLENLTTVATGATALLSPKRLASAQLATSATALVFHVAPDRGELAPGDHVTLCVNFLPQDAVEYAQDEVPLLINDEVYINMSFRGEGVYPHLFFSTNRITLPTVPLGFTATTHFQISAMGYEYLEFAYRVAFDTSRFSMTVLFPQGKILSTACTSVPVEVQFSSTSSVAFNGQLEFFDTEGHVFSLPISGCTENCLLTNYSFLQSHGVTSDAKRDDAPFCFYTHASGQFPVYLLSTQQAQHEMETTKMSLTSSGFVLVDPSSRNDASASRQSFDSFSSEEIEFVLQYLNANFLDIPVVRFPEDFADTSGRPLYALLDMICVKNGGGLAVPSFGRSNATYKRKTVQISVPNSTLLPKDQLTQLLTQYIELLRFLRSYGAMVHDVLPEFLLSQDFYLRACEHPQANPALFSSPLFPSLSFVAQRQLLMNEWRGVCTTAWMKVIYQVIKCFLLFRITWKGYQVQQPQKANLKRKVSARDDTCKNGNISTRACRGSNVYSEAEMVLIQWLCDSLYAQSPSSQSTSLTLFKEATLETHLLDFERQLQDGQWLFHLIAAHIPTIAVDQEPYQCFQWKPDTSSSYSLKSGLNSQFQHQADVLLQTLDAFGLNFGLNPKRFLLHYTSREMVILLLHLFQTLPQFIPKTTIEFRGELGQVMEKNIELKNPSQRPLRYHVFMDQSHAVTGGDKTESEFTLEANDLVLDPGKTTAFRVTFRPRFSRQLRVRLVFQAVKSDSLSLGGIRGATMVFMLESNIVSRKPVRILQLETRTYEKRIEEIVIDNPFPLDGMFKILMKQQTIVSGPDASETTGTILPSFRGTHRRRSTGTNRLSSANVNTDTIALEHKPLSLEDKEFSGCFRAQEPFYLAGCSTWGSSNINSTGNTSRLTGEKEGTTGLVRIRKNESTKIKLEFLPLAPGNYHCQLLLIDEKIGEFVYEVHGIATLPGSLECLEFQCEAASGSRHQFIREVTIPVPNHLLTRALSTLSERTTGQLHLKVKDGLKQCEESHHLAFSVDVNSPYFTVNVPELTLSASSKAVPVSERSKASRHDSIAVKPLLKCPQAQIGTPRSVPAGTNTVSLAFQPKGAGRYKCKLLLRSKDTICGSIDVRVYEIIATVKEPNIKTHLEFVAPARQSIVQEIPLSNPTDTIWTLKALFGTSSLDRCSVFSGPASLEIPAKQSASYPLTFTPSWICHETRTFVLSNTATQQQFEFELSGYGEEPLARDHVVLTCQARTNCVHEFEVFRLTGDDDSKAAQVFQVESDLCNVVGASTISVPSGTKRSVKYPLTFSPLVSGSYFGSVTFINETTKEYLWYTVEASVSPPAPENTLEMHTRVREAIGVEIQMVNPLDSATTFSVELRGRGLVGSTLLTLESRQSKVYELLYSPMYVTCEEGAIVFSSETAGQFWYRLNLIAKAAESQHMEDMVCAVGDVCSQPLWLDNPSDRELHLQYHISNTRNFSIKGCNASEKAAPCVVVPPFGRVSAVLEYTPSSLSNVETSRIVFFETDLVSDWDFVVQGRGQVPSIMKPLVVTARVNEIASTLFTFKNPFAAALQVDLKLEMNAADHLSSRQNSDTQLSSVFELLLKNRHLVLAAFELVQVPITFFPLMVSETQAQLVFRGKDEYAELEWRYPLCGVAEAPLHPRVLTVLACPAREFVEKCVECELLAAPDGIELETESFTVEWEIDTKRFGPLTTVTAIERALSVTPLSIPSSTDSKFILPYRIRFEPLRSYRGNITLLVRKKSGGLWRFDVSLDAGDPPIDDVLTVKSSLNQTSSVRFQLRNQFRQPANFLADFSAGSSSAFTVFPVKGELPSYGSEDGAVFVVSFTPTGYGKMQSGQLVIVTEEMQWTFNVKGAYPDATPSSKSSKRNSNFSPSAPLIRFGLSKKSDWNSRGNKASGSRSRQ